MPLPTDTLNRNIRSEYNRLKLVGLGVGIFHEGSLAYTNCLGEADPRSGQPITPTTIFRIASISKIFTTIAIMQLVEQEKIALDDPANQHLQAFKIAGFRPGDPPITIRHLLTHQSGLGEFAPFGAYFRRGTIFGAGRKGQPLPPLGPYYGETLNPDAPPEAKWAYANHAFGALGQIVADVSSGGAVGSQQFDAYMQQHVFGPLGMADSSFLRRPKQTDRLAEGHIRFRERHWRVPDLEIVTQADGSLFTTLEDMGKFVGALFEDAHRDSGQPRLLQRATLEAMWSPHYTNGADFPKMGLGFFMPSWQAPQERIVYHTGAWIGFSSALWLAPDSQTAVFAFTNSANSGVIGLASRQLRVVVKPGKKPVGRTQPPTGATITPEVARDVSGLYQPYPGWKSNFRLFLSYGGEFRVEQKGGELRLSTPRGYFKKGVELRPDDLNNPLAFVGGGQLVEFFRGPDGQVAWLGFGLHRFYKRPLAVSFQRRFRLVLWGTVFILLTLLILWLLLVFT